MRKRNIRHFLNRPHISPQATEITMTFAVQRDTAARLKEIAIVENLSLERLLTLAVSERLACRSEVAGT